MSKLELPVIVESVSKSTKEGSKFFGFAQFLLTGGVINVGITEEQYKELSDKEGEDLVCSFSVTPKLTSYKNSNSAETWFKPTKFLNIVS